MAAATTEPQLTTTENGDIETLLDMYVATAPSSALADDGVWSLNRAAAEGWRWRAGRAIDDNVFLQNGRAEARDQIHKNSLAMAKYYDGLADEAGELERAGVGAYVGGISIADKDARAGDSDRVRPAFTVGLHVEPGAAVDRVRRF